MQFPAPPPDTCVMYLVRHGATAHNLAHPPRIQGWRSNPPLSEQGLAQAEATGRLLESLAVARIVASPLLRARQTADAIARPHGLAVEIVDSLHEGDVGDWEGMSWAEIERAHPQAYRNFLDDPGQHPYLGGETMTQVIERTSPAFEQLLADHPGQNVIVVAHNIVNRAYLAHLLKLPMKYVRDIPQSNCGVNVLHGRAGKISAVTINLGIHLP
ncbi:MAG: histidine phosphatase family protein [Pirellulales bacterium]|nr:histidine phosphatase family protein [Pirellulales bacterium]